LALAGANRWNNQPTLKGNTMTLEELIKEIKKAGPVAVPVSLGYNELEVIVSKQDLISELHGTQSDEYQIFKRDGYRIVFAT
jgi:hypothetical protein